MSNRPLGLHNLLAAYLDRPPFSIHWLSSAEDKKVCVIRRRFIHAGVEVRPSPIVFKPELVSFDSGVAKNYLRAGFVEVKSAMADIGEATLNAERFGREKVLAFRPWLLDSGEVTPRDDPLILAQFRKFIQIYSGLDLISGDLFVCPYSALKGLYCAVEGFPGDERAPIEICQA